MEDDWIVVGAKKVSENKPSLCSYGNSCIWRNCKYLHERCQFHDKWLASGKKTRPCRHLEDGCCKYDHRDLSKLRTYYETLPVSTEDELLESFMPRGMDMRSPGIYDKTRMDALTRALLYRSLDAAKIKYEKLADAIQISYDHTDGEAIMKPTVEYDGVIYDARDYAAAWDEYNQEIRELMAW